MWLTLLKNNYFELGERIFQQVGGTSIGKKHAPACAAWGQENLKKRNFFPSERFRYVVLKDKTNQDESDRFLKRFIDDLIAAVDGTEAEAKQIGWIL